MYERENRFHKRSFFRLSVYHIPSRFSDYSLPHNYEEGISRF